MGKWKNKDISKEKEIRYILSLDGGGMRGIIPAYLIKRFSEDLKAKGDSAPFYSHFDLIAGTSTGALIALGLTCPLEGTTFKRTEEKNYTVKRRVSKRKLFHTVTEEVIAGEIPYLASPDELLDIYLNKGKEIFKPNNSLLRKLSMLVTEKYDSADFDQFLQTTYGNAMLGDAYTPTMAVSYNTLTGLPYIFRSWDSLGFECSAAARASAAAPTYFTPVTYLEPETGNKVTLIDGGVCANNPSLLAYMEARKLYPEATEFRMLSISTCSPLYTFDPFESVSGLAGWANNIYQIYASGNMAVTEKASSSIADLKYTRLWKKLSDKKIKMDDTSPETLNTLLKGAESLYEEKKDEIGLYLTALSENGVSKSVRTSKKNILLLSEQLPL